jgi:hypothetical protein
MQHPGYDLQTVLHPMADFFEQNLVAIQSCLELALIPLPLDRHAQNVRRSLQERDIVLGKLPLRTAVDFQYPVGRAIALKDDIHGAANTVFDEQLWCSKSLLILKVIADYWFAGAQGKPGRGFEIGPDSCHADNTIMPTDSRANQKPILRPYVFQDLAKLCLHPFGGKVRSLIQQLKEWRPL